MSSAPPVALRRVFVGGKARSEWTTRLRRFRCQQSTSSSSVGGRSSRQGFGSFHSDDIEALIRQSSSEYSTPAVYEEFQERFDMEVAQALSSGLDRIRLSSRSDTNDVGHQRFNYGQDARVRLYSIDSSWTFLNHGAFGAVLAPLLSESAHWRLLCERQPLAFFDRMLLPCIAHVVRTMSHFLNCPAAELLPLQNVTTGLNAVIRSLEESRSVRLGDEVICLSLTYGSTKVMLRDLCSRTGARLTIVDVPLPIVSSQDVVTALSNALEGRTTCPDHSRATGAHHQKTYSSVGDVTGKDRAEKIVFDRGGGKEGGAVKLVVLDHITSNTGMVLPVLQMGQACRQLAPHATVVIDAAHSLMSQEISIYPSIPSALALPIPAAAADPLSTSPTVQTNAVPIDQRHSHLEGRQQPRQQQLKDPKSSEVGADGAALSISAVADVWLTNGHKWLSAPKGCAFMWVSPVFAQRCRPVIVSHGFAAADSPSISSLPRDTASMTDNRNSRTGTPQLSNPVRLLSGFAWDGCRDYAALLSVPSALRFWQTTHGKYLLPVGLRSHSNIPGLGETVPSSSSTIWTTTEAGGAQREREIEGNLKVEEGIVFDEREDGMVVARRYMRALQCEAAELLHEEWHGSSRAAARDAAPFPAPKDMRKDSPMCLVPLPARVRGMATQDGTATDRDAFLLQELLHEEHQIEVPVKCIEGRLYVRISAHIHNSLDQYAHLAYAIKTMVV